MSINWRLDAEPQPQILRLPQGADSLDEAQAAIELWEHYTAKTLDPTQALVVQMMMAQGSDGRWCAATTGREMPRQNGKGDEIEVVEMWGLLQRGERILHSTHDAVLLPSLTQQRLLATLDHRDLRPKVKRVWRGTGQQMIEMRNSGAIWYRARSTGGGRGADSIDRLVVDEAQQATEVQISAVSPTLLANENPQMNVVGTSALEGMSEWWWRIRRRALLDDPGAFGYVGHTAEVGLHLDDAGRIVQPSVDLSDRGMWAATNPAISHGRGRGMDYLEEQWHNLGPDAFAREHLGVWAPPPVVADDSSKIPHVAWMSCRWDGTEADPISPAVAFDVSRNGEWASIVVAAGDLHSPYVELVDHRRGVGWLPERLIELVERWSPHRVGFNAAGAAGAQAAAVLTAFVGAGIAPEIVAPMGAAEFKAACGAFFVDVIEGRLRHIGQAEMDAAAAAAVERPLGDGWAWDVRRDGPPISPMVAATVARALLRVDSPPAPVKPVYAY